MKRKISPFIELIPIIIIALSILFTAISYPNIPSPFPTHFDFTGTPDAYEEKSFFSVYFIHIILIITYLSLTALNWLLIYRSPNFMNYINIPMDKSKLNAGNLEKIRTLTFAFLYLTNFIIVILFSYINFSSISIALGNANQMNNFIFYGIILLLFVIIIPYMILLKKLTK